jgi:rhodanese-related sulfurtransferase
MRKHSILSVICLGILLAGHAQNKNTYTEVTLPQLLQKLKEKDTNMVVLDVRSHGEYYDTSSNFQQSNIGHIKGAINIPIQDFRKDAATVHRLDAYKDKEIYVICSHSYRSRVVSNMLLDSGFSHVNNTRGGMTEFFRRYDEVAPYKNEIYETHIKYRNIAPAQLEADLSANKDPLLISISNTPRFFWDSLNVVFYKYFPSFKNAVAYNYADSLTLLQLVKKEKGRPVVLFNTVNLGAAELAGWLTAKGIPNVSYLVGGTDLFYEYVSDKDLIGASKKFLRMNSAIHFVTPMVFCKSLAALPHLQVIDLRDDSSFNKITNGAKYSYKYLKRAVNFFYGKGEEAFKKQFPAEEADYVFINQNGIDGLAFADSLAKSGYRIHWLNGGLQEWEWYMNNVETFSCNDYLVK